MHGRAGERLRRRALKPRPPEPVRVSIVIPTLDEADRIATTLLALQPWRGPGCEVVIADGGSGDGTPEMAAPLADRVLTAPRGRAAQMNAGAAVADG